MHTIIYKRRPVQSTYILAYIYDYPYEDVHYYKEIKCMNISTVKAVYIYYIEIRISTNKAGYNNISK